MDWLRKAYDIFFHLDKNLNQWAGTLDGWLYAILFAIIFCETGLLILPFLPGDSLLFALGALGTTEGSPINLPLMGLVLALAAILGDAVNYSLGARLGPRVFSSETSRLLNKKHLQAAHQFYEKYGGKTIILARFIPIIRTFAPFVAGIGKMTYWHFAAYNIVGAILWVASLMGLGYAFGQTPFVKKHFEVVIVGIIVVSVMPAVFEFVRARMNAKKEAAAVASPAPVVSNKPGDQ